MLLGPRTQPSRDRHDARTIAVCRTTQPYLAEQFRLIALSKHGDEPPLTLQICALPNREPPSSVFLALPPRLFPSDLLGSQASTGYGKCEGCPVVLTPANNCTAQSYSINGEDAAWKRNYRIQTRKRGRKSTKEQDRPRTGEEGEGKGFLHKLFSADESGPTPRRRRSRPSYSLFGPSLYPPSLPLSSSTHLQRVQILPADNGELHDVRRVVRGMESKEGFARCLHPTLF